MRMIFGLIAAILYVAFIQWLIPGLHPLTKFGFFFYAPVGLIIGFAFYKEKDSQKLTKDEIEQNDRFSKELKKLSGKQIGDSFPSMSGIERQIVLTHLALSIQHEKGKLKKENLN